MCGITGFVSATQDDMYPSIAAMTKSLAHRGPDDEGTWIDVDLRIALGHRRLSILDLSLDGHQPMISSDERYVIVFNGEIYNFKSLRTELIAAGYNFRSQSDTEVLIASVAAWGIDRAVPKMNGMFAFAILDKAKRTLHLARDRVGEKPLYYGWNHGTFLFGSEIAALEAFPKFERTIDIEALGLFFRYGYVPAPRSIYKGIKKLLPGSILSLDIGGRLEPVVRQYWSLSSIALSTTTPKFEGSFGEATVELERLLIESVSLRMESDVPLGAFLSGGVDSSLVVALTQKAATQRLKTFTIGFDETPFDEAPYAKQVATYLGTDHHELYVTRDDARSLIPTFAQIWDEPFADSSQIPTALLAQLTRRSVTVVLSGDGGDELFAGYNRYYEAAKSWELLSQMPEIVRRTSAVFGLPISLVLKWLEKVVAGQTWSSARIAQQLQAQLASVRNRALGIGLNERLRYRHALSHWAQPNELVVGGMEPQPDGENEDAWGQFSTSFDRMMHLDTVSYLLDDILVKVDRATMAVGLEARVPLLDHRLIEFAWTLPDDFRINEKNRKGMLKEVLYRHVPRSLVDRPKKGFSVPLSTWLTGPVKDWAASLVGDHALSHGLLNQSAIRDEWAAFNAGRSPGSKIWDVLMFQSWYQHHLGGK